MARSITARALVAALKREGVRVKAIRSWRSRNRSIRGAWGPVHGVIIHHTVTSGAEQTVDLVYRGRSDLPGPLAHGVTLELERLRGAVDSGFARLDGRLDLLTQRDDQTDKALDNHEQRITALERARWPLPSLAVLVGAAGCALSAWQLIR